MSDTTALSPNELPPGARCAVHPESPARATCSRCGNFACEACETRSDTGAILCKACETAGDDRRIPWEERASLGIPRAFVQTAIAVMIRPWELFSFRAREPSILPAVLFGWAINVPAALLGLVSNLLSLETTRQLYASNPLLRDWMWLAEPPFHVGVTLGSILAYPIFIPLYGALWHVPLLAFGGTTKPFKETARAMGYLNATLLPFLVFQPLIALLNFAGLAALGGVLALPWFFYAYAVAGIAVWKIHRCDGWKIFATVGAQWAFLFAFSCCLGAAFAFLVFQNLPIPVR